jgi:hypothetical protein
LPGQRGRRYRDVERRQVSLIVNQDDAEREFAYTSAAEASFAKAKELGWMVISMKDDWKTVFQGGRQLYASH